MRKVREATDIVEAFLYETESRYLWKAEGAASVTAGGLGPKDPGLNQIQKLWVFYNRAEDDSESDRREWEIAKFMIGPHVPKGIKKINAKDKKQRNDAKRRREAIMDRVYYEVQGVIPKKKTKDGTSRFEKYEGWDVKVAETEEELQDEMRRWVAGIKDPHDNVIDYVKAKIKTERETAKNRAQAQRVALERAMEEEGVPKTQLIPMTGKAAQEFLERVRARVPGTSKVMQDSLAHNSAYEKYIKKNPEVGMLEVDEEGNITSKTAVDPKQMVEMLRKPDEREAKSLQDLVSGRRPTMQSLQDDEGVD